MTTKLHRRDFLAGGAAVAGLGLAAPSLVRAEANELRILTWEGYAEPTWLDAFKAATGASVNVVYVGSADEMFAKMQGSSGADYDVVSFDTSLMDRYIGARLIAPVDAGRLANAANLAPAFREVPAVMRDGKAYGVPFAWGSLPLVYDKAAFPVAPDSWAAMWDPVYAQQMTWQDDANNSVTLAGIVLGLTDPFNPTDAEFDAIKAKLVEQKQLLLTYYAGFDDGVNIFSQSGLKLMYSMGEPQVPALKKKGVDAALTIPKEGAIGWLDCWEVSAGAKNVDLAHKWIDACLDAAAGKALTEKSGYGNTTNAAVNEAAGMTYGDKLVWLLPARDFEKRVAVWNEVKAS